MNINNNTAYISVNKFPNNNNDSKTKYLTIRWNQHVAKRNLEKQKCVTKETLKIHIKDNFKINGEQRIKISKKCE